MHGFAAIDADGHALTVGGDVQFTGVAGGAGDIEEVFTELGIEEAGESSGEEVRIGGCGCGVDDKAVVAHVLRRSEAGGAGGALEVDEPGVAKMLEIRALR